MEQVLEAVSHKAAAVRTPATHLENYPRHAGHCRRSKGELISDVLLWTPSHGRARLGRPARTYLQQIYADTGYNLEDLPRVMDYRDEWWERVREIHASGTPWWWWWYMHTHKHIYTYTHKYIYTCVNADAFTRARKRLSSY